MNKIQQVTAEMLQIERANIEYNKATNFGKVPNGQEQQIKKMLTRWDKLKLLRTKLKYQ